MKNFDHFIISFNPHASTMRMTVDSSEGKTYGDFEVPKEAAKLIENKPLPYRLKAGHDTRALWGLNEKYSALEDFKKAKEDFIEACKKGEVEWSDPNLQCHHCGKYYDPEYEFIEDEAILSFCNDNHDDYFFFLLEKCPFLLNHDFIYFMVCFFGTVVPAVGAIYFFIKMISFIGCKF